MKILEDHPSPENLDVLKIMLLRIQEWESETIIPPEYKKLLGSGLKVVVAVFKNCWEFTLTLSWRRPLVYRNQSIDLLCISMDWFLYDNGLRHERVKSKFVYSNANN